MKQLFNIPLNRESNGELLRLICMQFILLHHFIILCLSEDIRWLSTPVSSESVMAVFVTGFVYVAVNCFILISGYYKIKFKWSGLLNLYLFIVFYNLLWMGAHLIVGDKAITMDYLLKSVLVFSHNSAPWFLRSYMILYCVSPILNAFIEYCSKKQFLLVLGILTVLNVYIGYGYGMDGYNPDGYNYQQFIYIYMIGAYLRKYYTQEKIDTHRWKSFALWCGMALMWGGLTIINAYFPIPAWHSWTYNNPVVIIGAISFFCFAMSYHFESRWVNYLAISALAIYLMQAKQVFVYVEKLLSLFDRECCIQSECGLIVVKFAVMIIGAVAFSALCIAIDQVRRLMIEPLIHKIKIIESRK